MIFRVRVYLMFYRNRLLLPFLHQVFQRERLNGHYGVAAFVLANTLSSAPYLLLISAFPATIAYVLVGLHPGYIHVLYYVLILYSSMLLVESLMMMVASIVPDFLSGIIVGAGIQVTIFCSISSSLPIAFLHFTELRNRNARKRHTRISLQLIRSDDASQEWIAESAAASIPAQDSLSLGSLAVSLQGIFMLNGGFFRLPHDIPKPFWRYPISYMSFHTYALQVHT
jgi:hypothetical protein